MSKTQVGRFFEDFEPGEVICHGTPRTVTDGDAAVYTALTGCREAASSADTSARLCGMPRRPLNDWLVFNIAFGRTVRDISHNAIANLGYAEVRFMEPVYPGSTLRCESSVIGLRASARTRTGIVHVRSVCLDETGKAVLSWVRWVTVPRSAESHAGSEQPVEELLPYLNADTLSTHAAFADADALRDWCRATASDRLWDSYAIGERIDHPSAMTIEEADHMSAARLYQNTAQVHFCGRPGDPARQRIVYGGHVISICHTLAHDGLENRIHVAAVNAGRHHAPVFAGDVLRSVSLVLDRQAISGRADIGLIRLRLIGVKGAEPQHVDVNSAGEPSIVLDLDYWTVMPRAPMSRPRESVRRMLF